MKAQIKACREARPSRLYVAVDGSRADRSEEAEKCAAVRDCVKAIDWPCEVKTLFRERNRGCRLGVSEAIAWFFENEPEGIVLEDDCRPMPEFFRFATEMLERYREDEQVGAVNGFNFFNLQTDPRPTYHFSSHMDVWGWASWRRVWKKYDVDMKPYLADAERIVSDSKMTPYYKRITLSAINSVAAGMNTWDVQFSLAFLANHYLSVVPRERLIINAGLQDDNSTHTGGYLFHAKAFTSPGHIDFPLVHPVSVACDELADRKRERKEGDFFTRALTYIGSAYPWTRRLLP